MQTRQLRYELQTKKDRVLQVQYSAVVDELKLFFEFLNKKLILKAVLQELTQNKPSFQEWHSKMQQRQSIVWPETEIERVKLCLVFLEECTNSGDTNKPFNIAFGVGCHETRLADGTTFFLEQFFLPFCEYLDSRIEEQSVILYTLQRFKARSEWFEREKLFDGYNYNKKERKGEAFLDATLRQYLFDQGIDYPFSQPASPSGKADVIAGLESSDPLVLEVKVFDPATNYDKAYVRQGFKQVLAYANDYNKPAGYLVVFNVSEKELRFDLGDSRYPPRLEVDSKTIYIIMIDVFPERVPASKRKEEPYVIDKDYLLQQEGS